MDYQLIFKALADEKRIMILKTLNKNGSTCVCDLVDAFNLSQSKLSYHLKLLLEANLITKTSEGKWNYYDVNKSTLTEIFNKNVIKKIIE